MDKLKYKNHSWLLTIIAIIIQIIGILIIYSTTYQNKADEFLTDATMRQIYFFIIGLIVYFGISFLDISWLNNKGILNLLYIIIIGSLIYVRLFGDEIANTNRWIRIGGFGIQPAEYAKIVVILLLAFIFGEKKKFILPYIEKFFAWFFSLIPLVRKIKLSGQNKLIIDSFLVMLPILLLILVQPALGNTLITFFLYLIVIYIIVDKTKLFNTVIFSITWTVFFVLQFLNIGMEIQRVNNTDVFDSKITNTYSDFGNINYFIIIIAISLLVFIIKKFNISIKIFTAVFLIVFTFINLIPITWNNVLRDYQRERLITYIVGPEYDKQGNGYQLIQSKIAIGSGMIFGRGYLNGTQSGLNKLSESHNDFIFASYAEQFGFVGSLVLLILYLALIFEIIRIGDRSKNKFGRNISFAVAVLILLHIFINIGMNIGKLPVTGIPLPLMSSGGSSILVIMIALSFVQSVNSSRRAFDFADELVVRSIDRNRIFY